MEWIITQLNMAGKVFVGLALPMLLTSILLTGVLLLVESVLRARVRASLRYWLATCVLAYLILTPLLSLRPPSTHGPAGQGCPNAMLRVWEFSTVYAEGLPDPVAPLPPAAIDSQPQAAGPHGVPAPTPVPAGHTGAPPRETPRGGTPDALLSQPATGLSHVTLAGVGERSYALTWQGAAFLLWLIGAALTGAVLIGRALAACRRVDRTLAANHLMNDILLYCRKRMGIKGPIRLRIGEEGTSPVVCGLVNPVIVVPRNLAPTLGSRHLRDVLFHELAHVKRHDLWVNLAQNILQVVYFYNPLLLVINAVIRRLREEAADEKVLDTIGDADHAYARRLAEVATLATKPPTPNLNLIAVA
jgi:Zn-dependent protease with chaperone function